MSFAVMPMADYKGICDKVREKTDSTDIIKSGEIEKKIDAVYEKGQISVLSSSEYLKGKEVGNSVTLTPISQIEHDIDVLVKRPATGINLLENAAFEVREINEEYHDIFLCSTPFHLEDDKEYTINFPNATDLDNFIYIARADWNISNGYGYAISELPHSFILAVIADEFSDNFISESREYRV